MTAHFRRAEQLALYPTLLRLYVWWWRIKLFLNRGLVFLGLQRRDVVEFQAELLKYIEAELQAAQFVGVIDAVIQEHE